jgi:hypothetical protein
MHNTVTTTEQRGSGRLSWHSVCAAKVSVCACRRQLLRTIMIPTQDSSPYKVPEIATSHTVTGHSWREARPEYRVLL